MFRKQRYALRLMIDRISIRERVLLLATMTVLILAIAEGALWLTNRQSNDEVEQRIAQKQQETAHYETALASLKAAVNNPRIQTLTNSNNDLNIQINNLEQNISDISSKLVPPDRMITLLKELLDDQQNLSLRRFDVNPVVAINSNIDSGTLFYRHGLALELEGEFESLTDYLAKIEALPTQLFWDKLMIDTKNFPLLNIQIEVHTLSQEEEWLNV